MYNWLKIGWEAARVIVYTVVSVLLTFKLYAIYVQPELIEALGEARDTVTKLASLAGVKSAEYRDSTNLEKKIAQDIIKERVPELDVIKMLVSPATWEDIETTIEENPAAIIQLYEKYGHLLQGQGGEKESKYQY